MKDDNKKKKSHNEPREFEFCEVCKLNHSHGRRHNFFPSHKKSLSNLLSRFQSKLSDVKFFLKTPMLIHPEHAHQNRLWCVFCNFDILELGSILACSNAVEHLASEEHWKRVKGFMWKYGGGMDRVDSFRITQVDFAKWEKKCKSLKVEAAKTQPVGALDNIHNEHNAESVNSSSKNNLDSLNFLIPNHVIPLHSYTNERGPLSSSVLSSSHSEIGPSLHTVSGGSQVQNAQHVKNSTGYTANQHLARECLSYGYSSNGSVYSGVKAGKLEVSPVTLEGNIHTGAPPPWLDPTKGDELEPAWKPELREPVSSKAGKSKLNPKRVGAAWAERRKLELEMERRGEVVNKSFDANWLPNFGRVWQSGTRKESKKQFHMENNANAEADNQSEEDIPVQPYISKRMRKDTGQ